MSEQTSINLATNAGRLRFLLQALKKHAGLTGVYFLVMVGVAVANAVIPYFYKLQIDVLEQRSAAVFSWELSPLLFLSVLLLLPALIELIRIALFDRLEMKFWNVLSLRVREATERLVWGKMRALDAGFFQTQRNQKLLHDVISSAYVSQQFFRFITQRTSGLFTLLAIIPLLAFVSKELLLLILVTAICQYFVSQKLHYLNEGYTLLERRASEKTWHLQDLLRDEFFNLQSMGEVERFIVEYYRSLKKSDDIHYNRQKKSTIFRGYSWFFDNILMIGANIFVGYQVIAGNLSIGTFTLTVSYTTQINRFFSTLISSADEWRSIGTSLTKLNFFFNLTSRLKTTKKPQPISSNVQKIELQNVSFTYPEHFEDEKKYLEYMIKELKMKVEKQADAFYQAEIEELEKILAQKPHNDLVLQNVSLPIEKGKITALVGRNGSGKTTLTHLLQHHYEPTKGKVLLDGEQLFLYDGAQLRSLFSWLQQKPFILERYTIKDNLLLGADGSSKQTQERMQKVLRELKLDRVIEGLPKGVETVLGEDTSLSGGQQQLLAVARTIIQNRPFVIFDEGSSQLDVEKEFMVLEQLKELKKHAGILFITHRMSVARKADVIYVIDQGKIVEHGSHAQLLEKKGLYYHFWEMQVIA